MSAKIQVDKYFQALQRLIERGGKINNDTVALEAGTGRGSIKNSRAAYKDLITAIEEAAREQAKASALADPLPTLQQENRELLRLLDSALEREVALVSELYSLREEAKQLRDQLLNISPLTIHTFKNSDSR